VALSAAIRTRQFWQMAISFFIVGSAVATLYVHFMPVLIGSGFSKQAAATVAIVLGPAALIGRIGGGYLLDRFTPHYVAAGVLILPAISYGILLSGDFSLPAVYVCALSMGFILGAEADFMAFLASRYFGQHAFGALYGILLGIFAIGYGIGPVVTGRLYDVTKSYHLSFIVFGCATLMGAFLIARLGPVKKP
jgi:predicted MFS family arabinose efflux permease